MKFQKIGSSRRWAIAAALLAGSAALTAPVPAGGATPKKHLSLSSVSFIGTPGAGVQNLWIAQGAGFFKKQGLNVTFLNSSSPGSGLASAVVTNAAQFSTLGIGTAAAAIQQGGGLRAILNNDVSTQQEVAITQSAANAHQIPTSGTNAASALRQLMALKGSHLLLGVTNTASNAYVWFVSLAVLHGLTIGPNGDVNVQSFGSAPVLDAAINSGKVDGIVQVPPITTAPAISVPFININLNLIPPAPNAPDTYVFTSTSMIQQHRDTVQAYVNAIVQAWLFERAHPSRAEKIVANAYAANGITSPEEAQYLFSDAFAVLKTPVMSKAGYANSVRITNGALTPPVTLTYSQLVNPTFVARAAKSLRVKLPTS